MKKISATWIVPGKPWKEHVSALRRLFVSKIQEGGTIPIHKILSILPLNPIDEDVLEDLKDRGDLQLDEGIVKNEGEIVRGNFIDDNVGNIRLIIPKEVSGATAINGEKLSIKSKSGKILFVLSDLPRGLNYSGNFMFDSIEITEDASVFVVKDQVEPFEKLKIKVDLNLTSQGRINKSMKMLEMAPGFRRKLAMALRLTAEEEDNCMSGDPEDPEWFITRASLGVCRIQHGNEHVLGTIKFGPATLRECQEKLKELQDAGECP